MAANKNPESVGADQAITADPPSISDATSPHMRSRVRLE
jgi:hypothetical protein